MKYREALCRKCSKMFERRWPTQYCSRACYLSSTSALTPEQKMEMRRARNRGVPVTILAKRYGVSRAVAYRAVQVAK